MKILIVDDDPVSRRILREILMGEPGHQTTDAADGDEAWTLLDNPSLYFDVVFLDVAMPHNGISLLARIRESQMLHSLRVVMCTGTTDRETVTKIVQLGTRHFIVKPATAPLVQAKLKQIQAEITAAATPKAKFAGVVSV